MKRKNVLNIVWIFVAMTLLMGVMPSGAFAEELNTELNETDSLTLESIMAINGAKENIFNICSIVLIFMMLSKGSLRLHFCLMMIP